MKRNFLILIFIFGLLSGGYAQIGINTDDPKSTLDIMASSADSPVFTDGILVPRINAFPAINPGPDQDGLMLFLTAGSGAYNKGFHYWNNGTGTWIRIGEFGNEWLPGVNASGDSLIYARRSKLNGTDIVYTDDGRIGVGTDDPMESVELRSNGDNDFQLTSANTNPPNLIFLNTGGTVDNPTALAANQEIGSIIVKTNDGNQLVEVGGFRFYVDGTPSPGNVPSKYILSNVPDGSISQVDRLILRSSGNIGFSVDDPTATLHIRAGTASEGSAPLNFQVELT